MNPIDVQQAQLFVDDEIIAHQTLLERVVHQPVRSSHNPLLRPEKPWEAPSLSFIAGIYPAVFAARLTPARAMQEHD